MLIKTKLHKKFFPANTKISKNQLIFWFSLSMTFSAMYALLGLQQAFASEYVVQDDARQHVFWMLRFADPNLFPNDLIADYFQSVAPAGYSSLYRTISFFGIDPLFFNKLLPLILGLFTTAYCFGLSLQIIPLPFTGFLSTLLLNQNIWIKDDLISATPRAFTYPFLLAFLYYLSRKSLLPCLATIILLGLFYPQSVFICAGILILRLWDWDSNNRNQSQNQSKFRFSQDKQDYIFCIIGLAAAFCVMLPYALKSSEFAPVITVAQAKQLPEFLAGGRSSFFSNNISKYFLAGRSGIFAPSLFSPVTVLFGFLLPFLMFFPKKFPLLNKIQKEIAILPQILIVSVGMFIIAHILLFKLHLPSRYTGHTFRVILSVSAAIVLTAILEALASSFNGNKSINAFIRRLFSSIFAVIIAIALLFYYPIFIKKFPKTVYQTGEYPTLYQFFQEQPKDILIASIVAETNNLPAFTQRSILIGREYAIPYHLGYYNQFRQRFIDLAQAQYSDNLDDVKAFIQKYGVDFWLLESGTFSPEYIRTNSLLKQYYRSNLSQDKLVQIAKATTQSLEQGNIPALSKTVENCTAKKTSDFVVLDAKCIINQ
ncbi:hypothetical protein NIES267_46340 [Calothrix parasitica NIES-267]|uniref:Glycosyltransferase RgtA/B/C/D-like domain-containing protein n=1 Tax=Calothrix parasitica NIES-267 TaxID=1973488 RepID=A0A1Z4LV55_9CYAN|nr:hypothetical protein NIES267_46340 [Calothrix parasitica NIES-267]